MARGRPRKRPIAARSIIQGHLPGQARHGRGPGLRAHQHKHNAEKQQKCHRKNPAQGKAQHTQTLAAALFFLPRGKRAEMPHLQEKHTRAEEVQYSEALRDIPPRVRTDARGLQEAQARGVYE